MRLGLLFICALSASAQLATFNLTEQFSTNWPTQPIEFAYSGANPGTSAKVMLSINGGAASEVFYQWEPASVCYGQPVVPGCIIVSSNLPAGGNYTWTLVTGTPTASPPSNPAAIATVGNNIEITNGLTGVRIVTAAANPGPWNKAPIQGIQLTSGTWTGAGASANLIYTESFGFIGNCREAPYKTAAYTATGYSATTIVSGPFKTVVQTNHTFNRPRYYCGSVTLNPAGPGHYTGTYTVWAGLKTVGIDEDSDMMMGYYIPTYAQVGATTEQHRGANSYSQQFQQSPTFLGDPRCGYQTPGGITNASNTTPVVLTMSTSNVAVNGHHVQIQGIGSVIADGLYYLALISPTTYGVYSNPGLTTPVAPLGAYTSGGTVKPAYVGNPNYDADGTVDLTYNTDRQAAYYCSYAVVGQNDAYAKLVSNYPSQSDSSGWYSYVWNAAGGSTAPVIGMYQGQVGLIAGVGGTAGEPGNYSSNMHWISGVQDGGIQVETNTVGPSYPVQAGSSAIEFHRNWGIFVDTAANLTTGIGLDPIGNLQNILTGINLTRLATYDLIFPDPPGGWAAFYMSPAAYSTLIGLVQNGTSNCGSVNCYKTKLQNGDNSTLGNALLNMWQGNSTAAVTTALGVLTGGGTNSFVTFSNTLANGDNHWGNTYGYYQFGLDVTSPATPLLNAIILNPNSTTAQINKAKAMFALGGNVLWDPNWFNPNTGELTGNGNQASQYQQYQAQMVSSIPSQPFLNQFLATGIANVQASFAFAWASTGAVLGTTWYQSTFTEPTGENYLSLTRTGNLNFSSQTWQQYGRWSESTLTTPEPRFGGTTGSGGLAIPMRKNYSNGDGNTATREAIGSCIMANALQGINATLASNLEWGWMSTFSPSIITGDNQFLSTTSVCDPTVTPLTPVLGSVNVPGYHTSERFNFGTVNETALWFINGGVYNLNSGHRHSDDGQVSIYALTSPLAIDWNPNLFNPEVPGRFMHNSVTFDSQLTPVVWSADTPSLSAAQGLYNSPTNTEFESFTASTHSAATFSLPSDGTIWTRTVRTLNFNPAYPVIITEDSFSGASASAGKTLTWNMMAAGDVASPAGTITPTVRLSAGCQSPAGALPSNGTVNNLSTGLQNFNFTGVPWVSHPARGINWDLWVNPPGSSQQYLIGNWGHGCENQREVSEYQTANIQAVSSLSTPTVTFGSGLNPFHSGQQVKISNTGGGSIPSGLGSATTYYAVNADANSLQLSTTFGGSAITFTGGTLPLQVFALMNESQHILRIHDPGTSPQFLTIIAPYLKNATPTRTISAAGLGTQIVQGTQTTSWNDSAATFTDTSTGAGILTMYDSSSLAAFGMAATGGSQEASLLASNHIVWTISGGATGTRQLTPPAGAWVSSPPLTPVGGVFSYAFTGGLQAAPVQFILTIGSGGKSSGIFGGLAAGGAIQ